MSIKTRWLAWLIALSVALTTTAFLSLVTQVQLVLFVAFTISVSACFILVYFTMEFIVLREVNEVYSALSKLKKKDFTLKPKKKNNTALSPIQKLNEELYAYTSRKQQEIDQLKKVELYRREFLADVSHELKTPIFVAQGYIETLIDDGLEDTEMAQKFLHKASLTLDGLNNLVQDLVTLSQMEARMITMNTSIFSLGDLLGELSDIFEKRLQERAMHLHLRNTLPTCDIEADQPRIRQVFFNLIDNAIKYGHEGGEIEIVFEDKNGKIGIEIRDNGQGIPPQHLDHIFDRFYRVEKSRNKNDGGSGLGLAIVRQILEAHDSNITVKSKVNVQTTFTFELLKAS